MLPKNDDALILQLIQVTAVQKPEKIASTIATAIYNNLHQNSARYSDIKDLQLQAIFRRKKLDLLKSRVRKFEDHYRSCLPEGAKYTKVVIAQIPKKLELGLTSKLHELIAAAVGNTVMPG